MRNVIKWWASNSVAANLLMVALFIGGLVSFFTIECSKWIMVAVFFGLHNVQHVELSLIWDHELLTNKELSLLC